MDAHREACRRQHRIIGHFLATEAWLKGLDCVAIQRQVLKQLLGIERFKSERITWLKTDLEPWFPYQQRMWFHSGRTLGTIYLSRADLDCLPLGIMSDEARIARIPSFGPRAKLLYASDRARIPSAEVIAKKLALYGAGLLQPKTLKKKIVRRKKKKKKKKVRRKVMKKRSTPRPIALSTK